MARTSPVINVMAAAARKAARGLIRDFGEVEQLQVSVKGPGEFVSTADLRAERTLKTELTRARPGYGLLFEESGEAEGTDPHHRWIVDPLDGTTNFLHGIPHFAISIGLERDGEIVAGVIYEPTRDEMFWAEKGTGAYLNDRRLRVSARRQLAEAVIGTGIPFGGRGDHPGYIATLGRVMAATSGVRRLGAAALDLAYVAALAGRGAPRIASLISAASGRCKWPLAASTSPLVSIECPPARSLTKPPASRTKSEPAARSHGERSRSQ